MNRFFKSNSDSKKQTDCDFINGQLRDSSYFCTLNF